ncbi:MAG: PQQ-binding-like beta-propeller repeat protein [Planctomycetaceae bacterium]|nr:PQQ-binding-like beta-propeller repeat protein [Planctomycetaceae bacterium]
MRDRMILTRLLIVCFLTAVLHSSSLADDSTTKQAVSVTGPSQTSWVSFRNGQQQRGTADTELAQKLELLWTYETEFGVSGTAAIVGDHVYVPVIDGYLLCLNRINGSLIWKHRSIESNNPKDFAPGFKAAPLVTEQLVICGDEDGVLHAVDRKTGKKVWTFESEAEIAGGANLAGDRIIFGSHDSYLYCVKLSDGNLVWKFQTQDRVNCAPAIADGHTFISGCDEHLRVISLDEGKQIADVPLNSFLIASPALWDDTLYVGTYTSKVVALNWKKTEFIWTYQDGDEEFPYHSSAAITEKFLVVGGRDKELHCLDRLTGQEIWKFRTRAGIDSSPAIVDDRVFFGSSDGNLYGVDLKSGKEIFKHNAGRDITAGPAIGEKVLVVGAEGNRGKIYCFGQKSP